MLIESQRLDYVQREFRRCTANCPRFRGVALFWRLSDGPLTAGEANLGNSQKGLVPIQHPPPVLWLGQKAP